MSLLCHSSGKAFRTGWSAIIGRRTISGSQAFTCSESNAADIKFPVRNENLDAVRTKKERTGRKVLKQKDKRYIVQSQRARNSDLEARAEVEGLGWREVAAW